jgi:hypothetical protein
MIIFIAMSCGLLKFQRSTDDEFLWTPYGSDVRIYISTIGEVTKCEIDLKETIHTVVLFLYTNFYQFVDQNAWIKENYPKDMRYESIIVYSKNGTSGNILTAASIQYVRIF